MEKGGQTESVLLASGQVSTDTGPEIGEVDGGEEGGNHATSYGSFTDFEQVGKGVSCKVTSLGLDGLRVTFKDTSGQMDGRKRLKH